MSDNNVGLPYGFAAKAFPEGYPVPDAGEPGDTIVRAAFVAAFGREPVTDSGRPAMVWSDQERWRLIHRAVAAALRVSDRAAPHRTEEE